MNSGGRNHYHMVGVGGVGMSALAQVLLAQGHAVSGSDRFHDQNEHYEIFRKLGFAGIDFVPQDGSGVTNETAAVIVSTAIEEDNADILAARKFNVPVIHRSDMLAFLASGVHFVAVTGTSGKSTVTGMIGWVFECIGRDPTVVNGGAVLNWKTDYRIGNVRVGRSPLWVVEADESDRSLLRFEPDWVVVTNITKDHFELDEAKDLFRLFARRVRMGVVCGQGVSAILQNGSMEPFRPSVAVVEEPLELFVEEGCHGFWYKGLSFRCPLVGKHNAENAFVAVVLCDQLGMDLAAVRNALTSFKGIERRLEWLGEAGGITVIDDYAHNPAKIRAAWETLTPAYGRVLGVWRPHGFKPLAMMMDELTDTLAEVCREQDRIWILPVFYAGGTAEKTVASEDLVARLRERGVNAAAAPEYQALMKSLLSEAQPGDAVVCMGARDPQLTAFAQGLLDALAET